MGRSGYFVEPLLRLTALDDAERGRDVATGGERDAHLCSSSSTRSLGTMTDVEETVSVAEAARRLRMSIHDVYTLVLTKQLASVEAPSGRRVIPLTALEHWREGRPVSA